MGRGGGEWHIQDSLSSVVTYGKAWRIVAHIRQSRPDSGLDFKVRALKTFGVVPLSLGRGSHLQMFLGVGRGRSSLDGRSLWCLLW